MNNFDLMQNDIQVASTIKNILNQFNPEYDSSVCYQLDQK